MTKTKKRAKQLQQLRNSKVDSSVNNVLDLEDSDNDSICSVSKIDDLRSIINQEVSSVVSSIINVLRTDLAERLDLLDSKLDDLVKSIDVIAKNKNVSPLCTISSSPPHVHTTAASTKINTSSLPPNLPDDVKTVETTLNSVKHEVQEAIREQQDRNERKLNLVVSGMPESKGNEELNDITLVNEIHSKLDVKPISSFKIRRLGKKGTKPRPTLIQYQEADHETRATILRNAKKLRNVNKENCISTVFVNPDLTYKEREESWKLRQELKRRRENGEELIIRRGAIVTAVKQN